MAEAILAGKEVKEFSFNNIPAGLGSFQTEFPRLTKHFFVRYCPRNARNRYSQHEKVEYLVIRVHSVGLISGIKERTGYNRYHSLRKMVKTIYIKHIHLANG